MSSVSPTEISPTDNNAYPFTNPEAQTPRQKALSYAPKQPGSWGATLNNVINKANDYNLATDQIGLQNAKYNISEIDPFRNPAKTNLEVFKLQVPTWPPRTMTPNFPDTENSIQYVQPNRSGWTPQEFNSLPIPVYQPNPADAKAIPGVPILTSKTGPGPMSVFSTPEILRLAEQRKKKTSVTIKTETSLPSVEAPQNSMANNNEPSKDDNQEWCISKLFSNIINSGTGISNDLSNWQNLPANENKVVYVLTREGRPYYIFAFALLVFVIYSGLVNVFL
jgi:hypothetical protein